MTRRAALLTLALLLLPTGLPVWTERSSMAAAPLPFTVLRGAIANDTSLAETLQDTLSPGAIHRIVEAAQPTYDLSRVAVGHRYGLVLWPDGAPEVFTYAIDELRTLRVSREGDRLAARVIERSYDVRLSTAAGVIRSSLFETVVGLGERDQLALDLSEIFAWDVDFNTEIRAGDSFRVAVEKLHLDGRFSRYGKILAAEFVRGDESLQAIRFETAAGAGYYAADGTPLRKAFLRSPLRFARISSRFNRRRLHPVLKRVRPHLGVDYAAPTGTPVRAAAHGVVIQAGRAGNYGKAVRIRHANGYQTLYGHLSRIDVRRGQRVTQGTRIGAVGRTGLATGPHLDYRMTRNGVYVNPLRVQSPPAEPLSPEDLQAFLTICDRQLALLPPRKAGD